MSKDMASYSSPPISPKPPLPGIVSGEVIGINEEESSLLSKIFVTWLTPLLKLGYSRPLEAADIPLLGKSFLSSTLKERLSLAWQRRKIIHAVANATPDSGCPPLTESKTEGEGLSLNSAYAFLWACCDAFGPKFYMAGLLKLIGDLSGLTPPLLVKFIIEDLKRMHGMSLSEMFSSWSGWYGLGLSAVVFLLSCMNTICVNNYFTITTQTGFRVRSAASSLLYEKSLCLSGRARQSFSTGQIVNLMSTDSNRLEIASTYAHYLWSGPFQVIVIMFLLFYLLGWASFVGLAFLLIFIPIQGKITTVLSSYRKETNKVADKRVRLMQEIIHGIRVIKLYAWEESFLAKIAGLRQSEMSRVSKSQTIRSLMVVITSVTSIFSCILTFLTYRWMGNDLTPSVVFPTLALFALLRLPLMLFPMVISFCVDGAASLKRIQSFLLAEEIEYKPVIDPESPDGIALVDATFTWESSQSPAVPVSPSALTATVPSVDSSAGSTLKSTKGPFTLYNINMSIPKGSLVAVVGPVGCGKSSLLSALVGEMKKIHGEIAFGGSVGYCPQQAWIQNATVRDNILFGNEYDSIRYDAVTTACALLPDFAMLPDGDMTEVGEKGVNLSGGQKQRISLARAAYCDVDVVILDDPLSAVDAHVGKHLINNCINGIMKGKTRLLVTHQLHLLHLTDYVLVMDQGIIVEFGPYQQLVNAKGSFETLMRKHGGHTSSPDQQEPELLTGKEATLDKSPDEKSLPVGASSTTAATRKKITAAEDRTVGAVKFAVYRDYLIAAGGLPFLAVCLLSIVFWNVTRVFTDYWVSDWTSTHRLFNLSDEVYIVVYLGLGVTQGILAVINSLSFSWGGIKAAKRLHDLAVRSLLRAPVSFFDTNPTGRIINRLGKDQDALDNSLAESFRSFIHTFAITAATFLTMVVADKIFTLPLLLLLSLYYYVQNYYRRTNRELKRIDSISRSPYYAQFGETLTGLATIRAFSQVDRFIARNVLLLDTANRASFISISIQRWLGIRLETIGNMIIFCSCVSSFIMKIPPSLAGLAISYSLSVTGTMNWCVRQFAENEALLISAERLGHYAHRLPQEAPYHLSSPPGADAVTAWPEKGGIVISDLTMKYRPDLPPVLHNINVAIKAGERIGIVGRTGAGKSSIMQALFRIVEPSSGAIHVDGVDISTIGLAELRCRLSIIPQDPVIFAGTVRWNLDPTGEFNDTQLWNTLERSHLREVVMAMEGGLEGVILDGGENLSVGQRQLLCLARAILRNNRILVLDEATANIDFATDALIQAAIRRDFTGCTILTIAHRILTVIDYDRILVLDAGQVKEFDTPRRLLERDDSIFAALVKETGAQNEARLRSLVK